LLAGLALLLRLAADPLAPSLAADFDGDGRTETITAAPRRGGVRLEVRDAGGRKIADASAPAPAADVVHVELSAGSLGSVGALLEVSASTDASECVSVWRYKSESLTRLPIRDSGGKDLPECGPPGAWTYRWEKEAEGRPSALVRERTEKAGQGVLRVRDVFAFAGFSLDADTRRSTREIEGVPIPAWYDAVLYSTSGLEVLYGRFDLSRMRSETTLAIVADRERGVFALRFSSPHGVVTAPVDAYAARAGEATLGARVGERTARVSVRLGGNGSIPVEVEVGELGPPFDQVYGPAGSWHGRASKVFPSAADEIASEDLAGIWIDPKGGQTPIEIDGSPPYRVRVGPDLYTLDLGRSEPPVDLLLLPAGASGRPWGIALRGINGLERTPYVCAPAGAAPESGACRADGAPERLRRLGARANAR
jgi:hypothetical protein